MGRPESPLLAVGAGISPAESNRGGIVVQFVQGNAKFPHDVRGHGQDQRGHVGDEQSVQCPSHAVVVEPLDLQGSQSEGIGGMACRPFADAVNRLARDQKVTQQDQEGLDRREFHAAILRRQRRTEEFRQPHAPQNVVENG